MTDNPWEENYEIKNKEIQELLLGIASYLKKDMPKGWGFALQIFKFDGEAFFYVSSAERKTMIKALQEFIDREKAQ